MNSAEHWDYLQRQSEYGWEKGIGTPLGKLRLADALLARFDCEPDQSSTALAEKREWLKGKVGGWLRETDPQEVLNDYHVRRLVLRLFPNGGLRRLELRVKEREAA